MDVLAEYNECSHAGEQMLSTSWIPKKNTQVKESLGAEDVAGNQQQQLLKRSATSRYDAPAGGYTGFYLSGYGERNIFQHLRGCGELLLTHLVS